MNKTQSSKNHLLPFPVIIAATRGDVDAINQILKHYEGYIIALSTRRVYAGNGRPHYCVDEELHLTLENEADNQNPDL